MSLSPTALLWLPPGGVVPDGQWMCRPPGLEFADRCNRHQGAGGRNYLGRAMVAIAGLSRLGCRDRARFIQCCSQLDHLHRVPGAVASTS